MFLICAWCQKMLRMDAVSLGISHGLCSECKEREMAEFPKINLTELPPFQRQSPPEINLPEIAETIWGPMVVGGEG